MTAAAEEPPPVKSQTPILDQKLRNLPPQQLADILSAKEHTK